METYHKTIAFFVVGGALLFGTTIASAQQNVIGNLSATGNLEIDGNAASFGSRNTNPGYSLIYTDGNPATIDFSATASGTNWFWRQGVSSPQLRLSNTNLLTLFNSTTGDVGISLNPAGTTTFTSADGSGGTTAFLSLQSGSNMAGTAQRIFGQTDILSGYIDFKRFDTSGPSTGLTLGTFGGDVFTIRSSGASDAGNVGIGTTAPSEKLEVVGNVKVTGNLTSTGPLTAPAVTLPDGSILTSAHASALYNASGTAVASVAADGKVAFTNGLVIGSGTGAATLTPNSAAYLNQTLTNMGFQENAVTPTPVHDFQLGGSIVVSKVVSDNAYTYVVGTATGACQIGGLSVRGGDGITSAPSCFLAKLPQTGGSTGAWIKNLAPIIYVYSVAIDATGNVVVGGTFSGAISNVGGAYGVDVVSAGGQDGLIVKFNSSGVALWAKAIGSSNDFEGISSIATDVNGNIFAGGTLTGPISNVAGTSGVNVAPGAYGSSGLIVKLDSSGVAQWARAIGDVSFATVGLIATDANGNVLIGGRFNGTISNVAGTNGVNVVTAGGFDGLIVKLDGSGVAQWAKAIGNSAVASDRLISIAVDAAGNVFTCGTFNGTINNVAGTSGVNVVSVGGQNGLIVKLDGSGVAQWAKATGKAGLSSIVADADGNIFWASNFTGSVTIDGQTIVSDSQNGLVAKILADGSLGQMTRIESSGADNLYGLAITGNGLTIFGSLGQRTLIGDALVTPSASSYFMVSASSANITTPPTGQATALSWGNAHAVNLGVALGAGSGASGKGSAAMGTGLATAENAFSAGSGLSAGSGASALGLGSVASGTAATATGASSATGDHATAMGQSNASGSGATAMGDTSVASGYGATAMGFFSIASSNGATAMGGYSTASAPEATAIGGGLATGYYSTAIGPSNAAGQYSNAMGYSSAIGDFATAMGGFSTAQAYNSVVLGRYNLLQGNPTAWVDTDDLLVIGNGTSNAVRSNAFVVKKNGNTSIFGDLTVTGSISFSAAPTVGGQSLVTQNQLASYQTAAGSGANLTNLNASALATGTIPVTVLPADVTRLGPTVGLNTSGVTGNLAWVRVDKTGSTMADLATRNFADLQNVPTTLAGYGITDAVRTNGSGASLTDLNASALTSGTIPGSVLPADVTRLGPTVGLNTSGVTGNLAWVRLDKTGSTMADLATRNFADLQNVPTTLSGYGIIDAVQKTGAGDVVVTGSTTLQGSVTINEVVTINRRVAKLRVEKQGDLDMGVFTAGSENP